MKGAGDNTERNENEQQVDIVSDEGRPSQANCLGGPVAPMVATFVSGTEPRVRPIDVADQSFSFIGLRGAVS